MTYPITCVTDGMQRLQSYLAEERPMNLQEMRMLYDVLTPLVTTAKRFSNDAKMQRCIPAHLLNDWITFCQTV